MPKDIAPIPDRRQQSMLSNHSARRTVKHGEAPAPGGGKPVPPQVTTTPNAAIRQVGRDEDGAGIHAGNAKNLWVTENDVNIAGEGSKTGGSLSIRHCCATHKFYARVFKYMQPERSPAGSPNSKLLTHFI